MDLLWQIGKHRMFLSIVRVYDALFQVRAGTNAESLPNFPMSLSTITEFDLRVSEHVIRTELDRE
jgi:hypothetical protein